MGYKFNPFTGTFDVDTTGTTGSSARDYILVAASNAPANVIAVADYTCDGTDDHVQINAALGALLNSKGTVVLSTGTFSTGGTVNITVSQTLRGQGIDATMIQANAATFHTIHMGNRQADSTMRNFMGLEELSVSAFGGANNYDAVWVDGGGNGTRIIDVKASEGKYNFRLTDVDQAYFTGLRAFNCRTAGIYLEMGLENTWGNVAFYSPTIALSDNGSSCWLLDASAAQTGPNRFDRLSIYGALFFSTTGLTGTTGLKINVGATAFTIIGSLFESPIHHIDIYDETQLTLIGDSFIQNSGVSTNIVRFTNDPSSVTVQDCRLQQSTNVFNSVSGSPHVVLLGKNTNQGNLTNMFAGSFGSKTGIDTVFAGDGALAAGLNNQRYDYTFTNNIVVNTGSENERATINGRLSLAETTAPSTTSGYAKIYAKSDGKVYSMDDAGVEYDLTATGAGSSTPSLARTFALMGS